MLTTDLKVCIAAPQEERSLTITESEMGLKGFKSSAMRPYKRTWCTGRAELLYEALTVLGGLTPGARKQRMQGWPELHP